MKKKKKICMSLMAGALVTIMTTGAINAQIVSGYESFKRTIRNSIYVDNATVDIGIKIASEGKNLEEQKATIRIDRKNNKYHSTDYYNDREAGIIRTSDTYVDGDMRINSNENKDGEMTYNVYIDRNQNMNAGRQNVLEIPDEAIDILELSTDALIGVSKDHFAMSEDGATKLITGNFDKTQIPAIGNAFANLAFSQTSNRNYHGSYTPSMDTLDGFLYLNKIESGYINNVVLNSSIDSAELFDIIDLKIYVIGTTKTGAEIPLDFSFTAKISNKGTTNIIVPEINRDDENVRWNDYTNSESIDYYELNKEVIDKYHESMSKINDKMYMNVITDEEKQKFLKALDAFNAIIDSEDELDIEEENTEDSTETNDISQRDTDGDNDEDIQDENEMDSPQNDEDNNTEAVEPSDEGASDEGSSDETASDEEPSDETASDEGSSEETASDEGSSEETSSDEGSSEETASDEGSSDEGSSDEGSSDEGSSVEE